MKNLFSEISQKKLEKGQITVYYRPFYIHPATL